MRVRNHGKYTKMSKTSPRAIATCDYSGLMTSHSSLQKQMEYSGSGLVWTGFMVNPKFSDKPNPQKLAPLIKADPIPVTMPRPDSEIGSQTTIATSVGAFDLSLTNNNIVLSLAPFTNNLVVNGVDQNQQFPGFFTLSGEIGLNVNVVILLPNTYTQITLENKATLGLGSSIQLGINENPAIPYVGVVFPVPALGLSSQVTFVLTTSSIQQVYF